MPVDTLRQEERWQRQQEAQKEEAIYWGAPWAMPSKPEPQSRVKEPTAPLSGVDSLTRLLPADPSLAAWLRQQQSRATTVTVGPGKALVTAETRQLAQDIQSMYTGVVAAEKRKAQAELEKELEQKAAEARAEAEKQIAGDKQAAELVEQQISQWKQEQLQAAEPILEAQARQKVKGEFLTAVGAAAGIGAVAVAPVAAATGAAVSVGVNQLVKGVTEQKPLTPEEAVKAASLGAVFQVANIGVFAGAAKIAPQVVASPIGRVALQTGFGAASNYILSGGDIEAAKQGALWSFIFSAGMEFVARPAYHELKTIFGKSTRLEPAAPTVGAGGAETPTWQSEPLEELGGKRIRVVGGVTEKPVGTEGVTRESLISEYVGKEVPASHATLSMDVFKGASGEEILLKGFPEQARGWRSAEQMYHFYMAPGSEEAVTVYGGYMGIGGDYSGSTPKISFGGKPGAVVSLDTYVSPELLPKPGEAVSEYLWRFSLASGKTGISPETVLGLSAERQLSVPAAYQRFGVDLPGTIFQVEKTLPQTFQIKQEPSGILGKIPILRTMLASYTEFGVTVGTFKPVETTLSSLKPVASGETPKTALTPSTPTISVSTPIAVVSPSLVLSPPSPKHEKPSMTISNFVFTPTPSTPSTPSVSEGIFAPSRPSTSKPSEPSEPSKPFSASEVSETVFAPSKPSKPSEPSEPSTSSVSEVVFAPSKPSKPSRPSEPSASSVLETTSPVASSVSEAITPKSTPSVASRAPTPSTPKTTVPSLPRVDVQWVLGRKIITEISGGKYVKKHQIALPGEVANFILGKGIRKTVKMGGLQNVIFGAAKPAPKPAKKAVAAKRGLAQLILS